MPLLSVGVRETAAIEMEVDMNEGVKVSSVARGWDAAGMTASFLCVMHCVASPVIALIVPVLALNEGMTHAVLALAVLSFGLLAFVPGYRRHGRSDLIAFGAVGVLLIWGSLLIPEALAGGLETTLTVAGGMIMVVAHLHNIRLCRACRHCAGHSVADSSP